MTHEFVNETYRVTNLITESEEYLAKREELRLVEIALMEHREQVAALRRALPQGAALQDYEFLEGPASLDKGDDPIRTVRLSELFTAASRPLVIYHLIYGKKQVKPCPMCTMWIDGANGVAQHLAQNIAFAIAAAADPKALRNYARERGWNNIRLLSAGSSRFKYNLGSEDADGRARFDRLCFHERCRRDSTALLQRASANGAGYQGARHRLADARSGTSWT